MESRLKAMCEYIRRGQTSDFKLLSDANCILGRTVRVKELFFQRLYISRVTIEKLCAYKIKTNNRKPKRALTNAYISMASCCGKPFLIKHHNLFIYIFFRTSMNKEPKRAPSNVHIKVILARSIEFGWDPMEEATGFRVRHFLII